MKNIETVHLLTIDSTGNDTDKLISVLHESGQPAIAENATDKQSLLQNLTDKSWDICVCRVSKDGPIGAMDAYKEIRQMDLDLPILILNKDITPEILTKVLKQGFEGIISFNYIDHLLLTIHQTFQHFQQRKKRREAEITLHETEKRCHLLLDSSIDAIAYIHDGMHVYANQSYINLFGYEDLEELECIPIIDLVSEEDSSRLKNLLKAKKNKDPSDMFVEFDFSGLRADDSNFNAVMKFSLAAYDGEPCRQVVIEIDRGGEELKEHLEEVKAQDLLTGLYNRQYFLKMLDEAVIVASKGSSIGAVFYINIDGFKGVVNDVGHSGSDIVLTDVATLLKDNINTTKHLISRFGEDIFTILYYEPSTDNIQKFAKMLAKRLENSSCDVAGQTVTLSYSIGVSRISSSLSSSQEIMNKAQQAAIAAKERKRAAQQDEQLASKALNNLENKSGNTGQNTADREMMILIKKNLRTNNFQMMYQPAVSLRGDNSGFYEVLLRMPDAEGHEIQPNDFFPIAMQSGICQEVDRWVIENGLQQLSKALSKKHPARLIITISGQTLIDKSILPWLSEKLRFYRVPGDCLVLQFHERDALTHFKFMRPLLKGLGELRIETVINRFSCTDESLEVLDKLDVTYVKIEGSFHHGIKTDNAKQEEFKKSIKNIRNKQKKVIVPMVENTNILPMLWNFGVDYVQGYYLQKPSSSMDYQFTTEEVTAQAV